MVFGLFAPDKRVYFKPLGSKTQLQPVAELLAAFGIRTALVCFDRDYDHIRGLLTTPGVLYTYGYSWENDVWSPELIEDLFYTFCDVCRTEAQVGNTISELLSSFEKRVRWFIYADMLAFACGSSVIPRDGLACVRVQPDQAPEIDRTILYDRLREVNAARSPNRLRVLPGGFRVRAVRDTVGHVLAYFCFQLLRFLVKSHGGHGLRQSEVIPAAIRLARDQLLANPDLRSHYQEHFERWRASL
jgi:hypothetical protein